jgi:NADP-dependent aldehyde dehydrogenase
VSTRAVGSDPSFDPETGSRLGAVPHSEPAAVSAILLGAVGASRAMSVSSPAERSSWLAAIADSLLANQESLAQLANEETGLGLARLRGELAKAAASATFYATVAVEGSYLNASSEVVDAAVTLARWNVPVGPVAVFGASNFPFGFGVVGHDTASALAAGCPVIVKTSPAHPRLSVKLAEHTTKALARAGAPEGSFALVVGFAAGLQLVDAPEIRAVAFTGSQTGGMALLERAAARGIPFFAEMGTVNPVVVTRQAAARREILAAGFVDSFTLGAGQFCTKPGLLFAPAGAGFFDAVQQHVTALPATPLLTAAIAESFRLGVRQLSGAAGEGGEDGEATPEPRGEGYHVIPRVIRVNADDLVPGSRLLEECFGPVALVCEFEDAAQVLKVLEGLQPSLAASVFTGDSPDDEADQIVRELMTRVGRVAVNAWPTGVTTSWSQQHGGPWPATSRADATSVGAGALARFVRPVALQNPQPSQVPAALQSDNPWRIPRRINGALTLAERESQPASTKANA